MSRLEEAEKPACKEPEGKRQAGRLTDASNQQVPEDGAGWSETVKE